MTATKPNIKNLFSQGLLRSELFIGMLISIFPNHVRFNLISAGSPSGSHFLGARYGKGEVGEFVLIEGQTNLLLGRVTELRLPERERHSITPVSGKNQDLDVVGTIQLLGSVSTDSIRVIAGVLSYPRVRDRVYIAPQEFLANLSNLMELDITLDSNVNLNLGYISSTQKSLVSIKPEKLFGRHCAILGATGGGKSWTTARILEECRKFNAKIILMDATGEYRSVSGNDMTHVHLGMPAKKAINSRAVSLPATCFVESDFLALFEPAGKVQGPKMRSAIRSLRLAKLCHRIANENGILAKVNRPKAEVQAAEFEMGVAEKLDNPRQEFDVTKLVAQIEQECVYPNGYNDSSKWGGESGEFSYCLPLVSRISSILSSQAFECIFRSSDDPLTAVIEQFLTNDNKLLRICLSGIAYEFKAREIIANVIGRYLLNKARDGAFKKKPMVILVDEAHSFLGRQIGGEDFVAKLDAFELIAKEGRKFGLNICLATQRPRDVTEGVLSQIGTLIVHRLTNDRDRDIVERACGEIDRSASSFLPNLKPGEAVIIGTDFPIPLTIQINPPLIEPESEGPNFQLHWKS